MTPTYVGIDYSNERAFEFRVCTSMGTRVVTRLELSDWLFQYANGEYRIKTMSGDCVEQEIGKYFIFDDPKIALLFKLTWGGR